MELKREPRVETQKNEWLTMIRLVDFKHMTIFTDPNHVCLSFDNDQRESIATQLESVVAKLRGVGK